MRVGVNILNFGPGVSPAALLGWAQMAETLGYHAVMISDHVAMTPGVRSRYPEPFYDPFASLAWLAGQTKGVQIGTTVCVLPYRHPVLTARLVANIDNLSGGRFIFGVGVGGAEDEFRVLGAPFKRRGRLTNETLESIIKLWTSDEPVSYHGRLVDFDDVAPIRPLQTPHPPIWVGGGSEAAMRRAVRYGDAWHPNAGSPAWQGEKSLEAMKRIAEAEGRPTPRFCPRIRFDLRDEPVQGDRLTGVGSIDQVRSDLAALEAQGAEYVILDWNTGNLEATKEHERGWRQLSVLAEKVVDPGRECLR